MARDQNRISLAQAARLCRRFHEFDEHLPARGKRNKKEIHARAIRAGPRGREQRRETEAGIEYLPRRIHTFYEQLNLLDAFAKLPQKPGNGSIVRGLAGRQNIQPDASGAGNLEFQRILVWRHVGEGR
jgi:hypothetical protein